MIKSMTLAYFSGTGCTEMVADCFERQLRERGISVTKIKITSGSLCEAAASDYLLVLSPVYAYRMAELAEQWISRLPQTQGTPAAVISVSGGGEISPNTACRVHCKKLLTKKGYKVGYEKMLVMPSNFAKPTYQHLTTQLINIIPHKVNLIIEAILEGKENLTKPKTQDRFYASAIGRMEHFGARFFGASIRASDACNHCGLCSKNCPKENIKMRDGVPKFGFHCMWCLKCIYACPKKALMPRIVKSAVIKDGFDLKKMVQSADTWDGREASQGALWAGVKEYLKND